MGRPCASRGTLAGNRGRSVAGANGAHALGRRKRKYRWPGSNATAFPLPRARGRMEALATKCERERCRSFGRSVASTVTNEGRSRAERRRSDLKTDKNDWADFGKTNPIRKRQGDPARIETGASHSHRGTKPRSASLLAERSREDRRTAASPDFREMLLNNDSLRHHWLLCCGALDRSMATPRKCQLNNDIPRSGTLSRFVP
jgi:hypothetical protein